MWVSMLVKWLRHRDSRGQSFSCSYETDGFCVWGKSSPCSVSLFLCRYSTCRHSNGLLAALGGLLQDMRKYFWKVPLKLPLKVQYSSTKCWDLKTFHNGQCCSSKKVMSSRNLCLVSLETTVKTCCLSSCVWNGPI